MYAEDLDLGWRLHRAGWVARFEPAAVADHEHGAATTRLFGKEVAPHWQRSTYGFLARRRGVGYVWAVAFFNLVGAVAQWARLVPRSLRRRDSYQTEVRRAHARWILVHLRAFRRRRHLKTL